MKYIIPKSVRSKTQIYKTVQAIPCDLDSVEYYQVYKELFKIIFPSSRRIYFHEIFCKKLTLLGSHNILIRTLNQFQESYLIRLKKNKEIYKEIKKEKKIKNKKSEKVSKNIKRKFLAKDIKSNSNILPITLEELEYQNKKYYKRIKKNAKKYKPHSVRVIYTGMTN